MTPSPTDNYTQVPNALLELMASGEMGLAEMRVTLAILRETHGWHRDEVEMSYGQFETTTGLGRPSISEGIKAGIQRGTIERKPYGQGFVYSVVVKQLNQLTCLTSKAALPEVVKQVNQQVVKQLNQCKEERKNLKKEKKITASRKSAQTVPVENSQTELPIEQPPVAERKPVRARKAKEPNDHQRLMAAYQEALGYPIPNGAQEGTAAAWLLNNGYTIEHIIACYQAKKRDEFWQGKHLSLQSLRKDIGPYVASLKQAQARASPALGPPVSHYAPDARSQAETIRNMQSYLKSNGVVKHDPGITE